MSTASLPLLLAGTSAGRGVASGLPRVIEGALGSQALDRSNTRAVILVGDGDSFRALAVAEERDPLRLPGSCRMTARFHLALRPGPGEPIA